uniref:Pentraxin (PTX) domain-containing protein n=2 Tax=Oncorhynchus tshawytscha TaxID=74940 RepID=A0A8C8GAW8_ONCTS
MHLLMKPVTDVVYSSTPSEESQNIFQSVLTKPSCSLASASSDHALWDQMGLLATLLIFGVSLSFASAERPMRRSLVFPMETDNSYVELVPQKDLDMGAFTLCMRVATELAKGNREIILFAYRTLYFDELNMWREADGRYGLFMSGEGVFFHLPELNTFQTHLCLTWDSKSGMAAFHVDGKRSIRKVYKSGHKVQNGGKVILGQDPDSFLKDFDSKQSFVGEITDVNMWDYVLSDAMIEALHVGKRMPRGNIFDWETIELIVNGNVKVITEEL